MPQNWVNAQKSWLMRRVVRGGSVGSCGQCTDLRKCVGCGKAWFEVVAVEAGGEGVIGFGLRCGFGWFDKTPNAKLTNESLQRAIASLPTRRERVQR